MSSSRKEVIIHTLTDLYESKGRLIPEDVVDEAADINHPLHSEFEWDEAEAAREFRIVQAGALIRSVKVQVLNPEPVQVRAFINVQDQVTGEHTYVPQEVVHQDPMLQQVVLQQMQRDWLHFRRRYEVHAQFWQMIQDDLPTDRLDETG